MRTLIVATALAVALAPLDAQEARVAGRITGQNGAPVARAEVRLVSAGDLLALTLSSDSGDYVFAGLRPAARYTVRVRRLGYKPVEADVVAGEAHDVVLELIPAELERVVVEERRRLESIKLQDFHRHRERARFGQFFDEASIREKHPRHLSDLMRFVPGARLIPGRIGNVVRIRGCRPMLWVDGVRVPGAELDETVNMDDVLAVEVYNSFAGIPPQYVDRRSNCGAVIVWTKV